MFLVLFFAVISCANQEKKNIDFLDLNNKPVDISIYKGKKLVVNYWATWCGPCVLEMPDLEKLQELLKEENYVFLLVSDEEISKIKDFTKKKKFNLTYLKSTKSVATYGVYSLPTTFIFNKKGKKIESIVGMIDWDSDEIIRKFKSF
jgi:thiol-disulfide isomerase/thioredoxin